MMKSIVILYENNSKYDSKNSFDNVSAKELCFNRFSKLGNEIVKINNKENVLELISSISDIAEEKNADTVIFSYDDLPFISIPLINKMIENHKNYKAEYTYADGYPYGFSAEIIDKGALAILKELAINNHKDEGTKSVSRECIYNLLKTEINSFEVEAVISDEDYRLLRLSFNAGLKDNYLSSLSLYNALKEKSGKEDANKVIDSFTLEEICEIAKNNLGCLKTVPCFYNIQISDYVSNNACYSPYISEYEKKNGVKPINIAKEEKIMSYENFSSLVDKIASFSEQAVISLSLWGEAFSHPNIIKFIDKVLSKEGLSVFIETDGYSLTEDVCNELKEIVDKVVPRTNGWDKLMVAISLDSMSSPLYEKIHAGSDRGFEKAINGITNLYKVLPECVYPQFVRMNDNECELESFFRYWNDKNNISGGKLIIQKYDDMAGLLPQRKPADLSPIDRNVCWHLRRDMCILRNGDVPLCKTYIFNNIIGNVFNEELSDIWNKVNNKLLEHINNNYNDKCGKCDEYYTFNF